MKRQYEMHYQAGHCQIQLISQSIVRVFQYMEGKKKECSHHIPLPIGQNFSGS